MKPWLGILGALLWPALLPADELILKSPHRVPQENKAAIPEDAAQKEAEKTIKAVFKEDYAKRTPPDRISLAKNLLKQAVDTKDNPAVRFVLFRESQEIAARAGDIETAFRAIDGMSASFETSPISLKNAALLQASAAARTLEDQKALAVAFIGLSDEAMQARQFEAAFKASQGAVTAAKKVKDIPLLAKAEAQFKTAGLIQEKHERVKKANEILQADPDNAEANQAVGEFECFTLGDWDSGLPKLAKGSDLPLRTLATTDLSKPVDAAEQAGLGDAWWDRAQKESGIPKLLARQRAGHWYKQASQKLTGLSKVKVDKRLEELVAILGSQKLDLSRPGPPGGPGSIDITTLKAKKAAVGAAGLGVNSNDTGEVFTVSGKECNKYFFAHAPSTLIFDIPTGARYFQATGVKRSARVEGSWKYVVVVDGKTLFESKSLSNYEGCEVEITVQLPFGAKEIELSIDPLGSNNGDHSVWAFPRFQK